MNMIVRPLLYLSLCCSLAFSPAFGGEIFQKDFTQNAISKSDLSGIEMWTGAPVESWGKVMVDSLPSGVDGSPQKALTITTNVNNPPAPDGSKFCPSITVKTPKCGSGGDKKTAVFLLRFMVPVDGPYRADIHFGGNWGSNATVLVLNKNDINAMTKDTPTKLATYDANAWQELRLEFDCTNKTFSVSHNGNQVANGIPWNDPKLNSVDSLEIVAGGMPVPKDGTPVLYLQKIDISEE